MPGKEQCVTSFKVAFGVCLLEGRIFLRSHEATTFTTPAAPNQGGSLQLLYRMGKCDTIPLNDWRKCVQIELDHCVVLLDNRNVIVLAAAKGRSGNHYVQGNYRHLLIRSGSDRPARWWKHLWSAVDGPYNEHSIPGFDFQSLSRGSK
jgi:hypothetical protein